MTILETMKLTRRFGGLTAVNDFSVQVQEGEILGLIGPNGAGKTTIFNLISGAYHPTSGLVFFDNEDITGNRPHQTTRKGIARTFQQTKLFHSFTVLDNVLVGLYLKGRMGFIASVLGLRKVKQKDAELYGRGMEILSFTGLHEDAFKTAASLPHGKKRGLGVAIALSCYPKLLLLDEPMTGMNAQETEEMMRLIRKVKDEREITTIIIEHNMKAVMGLCDRIVVLNNGTTLAVGSPLDVSKNPAVVSAYLGG